MTLSYSQQLTMRKQRGINKQLKEMVLQDLKETMKKIYQNDGCEIRICIDANEQWNEK